MAHRLWAPSQPTSQPPRSLLAPVGVTEHRFDPASPSGEGGELDLALDATPDVLDPLLEQALGLGLREHQGVGVGPLSRCPCPPGRCAARPRRN